LKIKKIIRSVKYEDAKNLVSRALELSTGKEVEALISKRFREIIYEVIRP